MTRSIGSWYYGAPSGHLIRILHWFLLSVGYYCPAGQNVSNPFPCSPGHHCPEGSHEEVKCEAGTYQDESAQATCKDCFQGLLSNIKHKTSPG